MAVPDTIALTSAARSEGLESVVVGGNAVNLYAYLRTTFDVDLLIREEERARWIRFFEERGYEIFHATENFVRLRLRGDPAGALPLDLMLADARTFRGIFERSRQMEIAAGIQIAIPDPLHLIAMKLHALRSPHRVESGVDLQDVRHLIRAAKIDTASREFADILNRYASESIRTRILHDLNAPFA